VRNEEGAQNTEQCYVQKLVPPSGGRGQEWHNRHNGHNRQNRHNQ